jgi:hypothetical protein
MPEARKQVPAARIGKKRCWNFIAKTGTNQKRWHDFMKHFAYWKGVAPRGVVGRM